MARERTQGPQPGVARNTHHHRQRNPARRGGETHAGTSARSGKGPPTHQPHPHQQETPAASPSRGNKPPHAATHVPTHTEDTPTPRPPPQTQSAHTSTRRATNTGNTGNPPPNPAEAATTAASGPQPGEAGNRAQDPQPGVARGHPPPTPTVPQPRVAGDRTRGPQPGEARERPPRTHSCKRGTTPSKPADHSQEWRRPTPHKHQRTPARNGREPHPRPRPTAREGAGPPAATGGEPQPGEVGTRTQATGLGKAKNAPHHRHPTRERRETHNCKPHSEKGGGTRRAHGRRRQETQPQGFWGPPR